MAGQAVAACHELLLHLAGRLPDDVTWRLRDWLADDTDHGRAAVAATLPRALLRNRVGITDHERSLLVTGAGDDAAVRRAVRAVLPIQSAERPPFEFRAAPDGYDSATLGVLAVVRGAADVEEVLRSVRSGPFGERTMLVVLGGDEPAVVLVVVVGGVLGVAGAGGGPLVDAGVLGGDVVTRPLAPDTRIAEIIAERYRAGVGALSA